MVITQNICLNCVEAFKKLEEDFFKYLKSMGDMSENLLIVQNLKPFVMETIDKLKMSIILPDWYNQLPFDICASSHKTDQDPISGQ